jgi:cyclopropane fatty-acyl-phospholipid synthase-like methyltransferase
LHNDPLFQSRFPKSNQYDPNWIKANVSGGANALWLTEWLTEKMQLRPGMRVLDLGCGRAVSSIFLRREYGVQVWSCDLWFDPTENLHRIQDAGMADGVFPMRADAKKLPFPAGFFDAIISIDAFFYFGTDDHYLNTLARFLKPDGQLGIAGVGLKSELEGSVPEHLQPMWSHGIWCIHSANWWRRLWERTGIVRVETADDLEDGWNYWLAWHHAICPDNRTEIDAVAADAGRNLGYVRVVAQRDSKVSLEEAIPSIPYQYESKPMLKEDRTCT